MKNYRHFVGFALLLMCSFSCASQDNSSIAVILKKLNNLYSSSSYLSFDMNYTYSLESQPSIIVDSLNGKFAIGKSCSHTSIAGTETISDSSYCVVLLKDNLIMYITKSAMRRVNYNPVSLLDTSIDNLSSTNITLSEQKHMQVITINYPEGSAYKKAELSIDKKTGLLISARYIIKPSAFTVNTNNQVKKSQQQDNEWGIVECKFANYVQGEFDANEFNTNKYFIKKGNEFEAAENYKKYKVFIGSPDL